MAYDTRSIDYLQLLSAIYELAVKQNLYLKVLIIANLVES
jgi:hypothetical protein